jgi:hypothetical protein
MKRTCGRNIAWSIALSPAALLVGAVGGQISSLFFVVSIHQELGFASSFSPAAPGSLEQFLDVVVIAPVVETIFLALFVKALSYTSAALLTPPLAGAFFAFYHLVINPHAFFAAFGWFWIFAIVFIRARESGLWCGLASAALIHGLTNFYVFTLRNFV